METGIEQKYWERFLNLFLQPKRVLMMKVEVGKDLVYISYGISSGCLMETSEWTGNIIMVQRFIITISKRQDERKKNE